MSKLSVLVVIPVLNEEVLLEQSIVKLSNFLAQDSLFDYTILIADNGSVDDTKKIGEKLGEKLAMVEYVHFDFRGRGRTLKRVWGESKADIVSYMDVDLSTDLLCFPRMLQEMVRGQYDVAFGSRHLKDSVAIRSFRREVLSRTYNWLFRNVSGARFYDGQCGFKALTNNAKSSLLFLVKDNTWFFDSELLLIAQGKRFRLLEFPVKWVDNTDSKVRLGATIKDYLLNILRMRR